MALGLWVLRQGPLSDVVHFVGSKGDRDERIIDIS